MWFYVVITTALLAYSHTPGALSVSPLEGTPPFSLPACPLGNKCAVMRRDQVGGFIAMLRCGPNLSGRQDFQLFSCEGME